MSFVKVGPTGAAQAHGDPMINVIQTAKEPGNLRMLLSSIIKTAGCFTFLNEVGYPQNLVLYHSIENSRI